MLQVWTPPLTGLKLLESFHPWASLCSHVKWEPRASWRGERMRKFLQKGVCCKGQGQ